MAGNFQQMWKLACLSVAAEAVLVAKGNVETHPDADSDQCTLSFVEAAQELDRAEMLLVSKCEEYLAVFYERYPERKRK